MYRVLIVDDEVPFLRSMRAFDWEVYGCRCVGQAANGQEAMEKCFELAPHIVISDINMPTVDGLSLLSLLHDRYPEIQVILLTVHRNFEYAQKAVKLGACGYLVKDMDYRLQLPDVLEKAKWAFNQQPLKLNARGSLLHKSGHMLVIESDNVLQAYLEEAGHFLEKYAGTLITARLTQPYSSLNSLITKLDSLLGMIEEDIGIIVRSKNCFELLLKQEIHYAGNWLRHLLAKLPVQFNQEKEACYALACCGKILYRYMEAHKANIMMLERGFYTSQPRIIICKNTDFVPLPSSVIDEWVRRADALGSIDGAAEKYVKELVHEIAGASYSPPMVRHAFDRILYKYELRYAASSDEEAHTFFFDAPDISSLADKMLETVKKIRSQQNNYSFIICRAMEYMEAHMGETSLQLAQVAEYVCISPGYLSKKLKDEAGQTFQEMLIRMRMEYAAEVLKNSGRKVYEVAEMVGYENYRSFAAAFSNYYGVSPKKYH